MASTRKKTRWASGSYLEALRVDEVIHERLESSHLVHLTLEVVEGRQDDVVAALDEADGGQQLEYQRLGPKLFVDLKKRLPRFNGLVMMAHNSY